MLNKDLNILIVGLGLIGGSYAEGLTKNGYHVNAITRSETSINYALKHNLIKEGSCIVKPELINNADLIIFALYPKVLIKWLQTNQQYFKKGVVLTDVTGIKTWVIKEIKKFLRPDVDFVFHHPMAGKEVYGVQNADYHIFENANYIIIKGENNQESSLKMIEDLGHVLNFRKIAYLTKEEHDEMIGFLSQLTHCIAVVLMNSKESKHLVDYTGDSFRDLTRIASINEEMWTELFLLNKEALLKEINNFLNTFNLLKVAIEKNDEKTIKEMMKLSTYRRSFFNKKGD